MYITIYGYEEKNPIEKIVSIVCSLPPNYRIH